MSAASEGQEKVTFAKLHRQLGEVEATSNSKRRVRETQATARALERQVQSELVDAKHAGKTEGYRLGVEHASRVLEADAQTRIRLAEELALQDEDTGLYRKKEFLDRIVPGFVRDVARDRRDFSEHRRPDLAALWYMDIDGLSDVNNAKDEGLGHDYGDILISVLSNLLKTNIRQDESISTRLTPEGVKERVVVGSTSGRVGGDEFLTLQINLAQYVEAYLVASRVKLGYMSHDWASVHPLLTEHPFRPSVAIGIAVFRLASIRGFKDKAKEIADQWRGHAEAAMYVNKRQADHQVTICGVEYDGEKLVDWPLEGGVRQLVSMA